MICSSEHQEQELEDRDRLCVNEGRGWGDWKWRWADYYKETRLGYSAIVSDANFPTFKNLKFLPNITVIYFSKEIKQYISNNVGCLKQASTLCWEL